MTIITKNTLPKTALELGRECKRCGNCCSFGSGALVGDDKKRIAAFLKISEKQLEEKYLEPIERFNTKLLRPKVIRKTSLGKNQLPFGKCIFFDTKKGCKIQPVKPLECRIGGCSEYGEQLSTWFALNYFVNPDDPESVRQYSAFIKTAKIIPGGELKDIVKDKELLRKMLNYDEIKHNFQKEKK